MQPLHALPADFLMIGRMNAAVQALHLSNNGLKSLPRTLFTACIQLSALDLHNTEITVDVLRQVCTHPLPLPSSNSMNGILSSHNSLRGQIEGWEDFDERRRSKHQKQLDFRVVGSAEFDESADKK